MADNEETVVTSASAIIAVVAARRLRRRRQRSCWVRSWMLRRPQLGTHAALFRDLRPKDDMTYKNFCQMCALQNHIIFSLLPFLSIVSLWSKKAACASTQASLIFMNFRQIVGAFGDYSRRIRSPFPASGDYSCQKRRLYSPVWTGL